MANQNQQPAVISKSFEELLPEDYPLSQPKSQYQQPDSRVGVFERHPMDDDPSLDPNRRLSDGTSGAGFIQ
jgi:hypothetical protein